MPQKKDITENSNNNDSTVDMDSSKKKSRTMGKADYKRVASAYGDINGRKLLRSPITRSNTLSLSDIVNNMNEMMDDSVSETFDDEDMSQEEYEKKPKKKDKKKLI